MTTLPTISIIIPVINEEKNLKSCLDCIYAQDYPKKLIEVIVVDDNSTDNTIKIAKKFPVKIVTNGHTHGEIGKMIGLKEASGELFFYLDADIKLIDKSCLKKLSQPLLEDNEIFGTFTKQGVEPSSSPLERYLALDALQRDPIYQFFSPSVESTIVEKRSYYYVCKYSYNRIPPAGHCMYRTKQLLDLVSEYEMFLELDFLKLFVKNELNTFAYVPENLLAHHHVRNIGELIRKRRYNLTKVYLSHVNNRLYTWFNLKEPKDLLKIFIWTIYANTLLLPIIVGVYKSIKYKSWIGMYEPVVTVLVTDILIINFLFHSKARSFLINELK